jgi:hypothetical protein
MKKKHIWRFVGFGMLSAFITLVSCYSGGNGDSGGDTEETVKFVNIDYMDSSNIYRISKFRSGIGHDYSDSFEDCRSMKHYYHPKESLDWTNLHIYAPVSGTVTKLLDEGAESGSQIWVQSSQYPKYYFILFHVNHNSSVQLNGTVTEGQDMGTNISDDKLSDIAVGIATDAGWRLVSYFDVMTDALFQKYQAYGFNNRGDFQISKEDRDNDPLTCDGETFQGSGTLENWVVINAP